MNKNIISKEASISKMLAIFRLKKQRTSNIGLDLIKIINSLKTVPSNRHTVVFVDLNYDWENGKPFISYQEKTKWI